MADGDYEYANSTENRISAAVNAAVRPLRLEIQTLKKQMEESTTRLQEAERVAVEAFRIAETLAAEVASLRKQ